jgi:hypothetical protein
LINVGDLTTFNRFTDSDHDGETDLQEFAAGTDPLDASDRLTLLQSSLSSDKASLTLAWKSKSNRQYQIETRSGLHPDDAWIDSGLGLQNADGAVTKRTIPVRALSQFFRVRAIRPLSP